MTLSNRKAVVVSPKAMFFYKEASTLKKKYLYQRKKALNYRRRLKDAATLANKQTFMKLTSNLSKTTWNFFESQLRCATKRPQGWRFSTNDKIMSLALYKQTCSGYKFLSRIFTLPSRVTLMKLLNSIDIEPGINKLVYKTLKDMSANLQQCEKYCFVLFDEMSLSPNLSYNMHKDVVEGFEDFGNSRTSKIADHGQVSHLFKNK